MRLGLTTISTFIAETTNPLDSARDAIELRQLDTKNSLHARHLPAEHSLGSSHSSDPQIEETDLEVGYRPLSKHQTSHEDERGTDSPMERQEPYGKSMRESLSPAAAGLWWTSDSVLHRVAHGMNLDWVQDWEVHE